MVFTSFVMAGDRWVASSTSGLFTITIEPEGGAYQIGQYHNWLVAVRDKNNNVIDNAKFSISGGMIGHGHGLPSQPMATRYLDDGKYLVEGMLFNMAGKWILMIDVQTDVLRDQVRFDIELSF